jgi:hypothetical protein
MATYPTKLAEAFASQALEIFYRASVTDAITNSDYEGEIRDRSSVLNVLTFGAIDATNYDGSNMSATDLTESNSQLVTDQAKYIYFRVKDYDTFRSYIKNPESTIQRQVGNRMKQIIDEFVLGFYTDVASGNRVGTDYTTGTVEVTATTGAVAGSGTTFTASMVGRGFQADGHTSWYRVKTFTDGTNIVIEDDKDDEASAYTGGAISAGASYTIEAVSAIQVTSSNIFEKITQLAVKLNNADIPEMDRFLVLPSSIAGVLKQSVDYAGIETDRAREAVMNGKLPARFAGFDIYEVSDGRVTGNSTDGWHCLGGHKTAITFAMGMTQNGVEDAIANFGKLYKSLYVYGAKVADERRKALVEGYFKL